MLLVAFYKGTRAENPHARLFDRLICWWHRSRGRFSHAELIAQRGMTFARCWSASMRDGWQVREKIIDVCSGRWVIVALPQLEGAYAVAWMRGAEGRRYDLAGVLGFVLPWIREVRRWLYCSEAVSAAIGAAMLVERSLVGRELEQLPAAQISPSALYAWCAAQPGAVVYELPAIALAQPGLAGDGVAA